MAGVTTQQKQEQLSHDLGMHTEALRGRTQQVFFDMEKLEEGGFGYPDAPQVDFNKRAEFDAANMNGTDVNLEIRKLTAKGYGTIVIKNPGAKHSLGVGMLHRLNLIFEGSLGYFGCGLIDGPNVRIHGRVGWACGENMMGGSIVIDKNAGSQFGAAIRGGDLVCKGSVGSRTGIDQKGGTIIVGGDTGAFTGFMMQRGRMIICGNAGKNLGDSMYDGTIYVGGDVEDYGVDAVPGPLGEDDKEWLARKLKMYDMLPAKGVNHFTKINSGKQLWNYDNLEPNEKKLVL
jgi:glutamate synthase domain-containing protein 3